MSFAKYKNYKNKSNNESMTRQIKLEQIKIKGNDCFGDHIKKKRKKI